MVSKNPPTPPAKKGRPVGSQKKIASTKPLAPKINQKFAYSAETKQEASRLYRAGVLTVEEISAQIGVPVQTIYKWSSAYKWTRDLRKRIRDTAATLEAARIASEYVSQTTPMTDDEVVDATARVQIEVTGKHKKDLMKAVDLQMKLVDELSIATEHVDKLEEFIDMETQDDRNNQRRSMLMAAIGIGSRMKAMQAATASLTALIKTQRMVYRIADKGESDEEGYEAALKALRDRTQPDGN